MGIMFLLVISLTQFQLNFMKCGIQCSPDFCYKRGLHFCNLDSINKEDRDSYLNFEMVDCDITKTSFFQSLATY